MRQDSLTHNILVSLLPAETEQTVRVGILDDDIAELRVEMFMSVVTPLRETGIEIGQGNATVNIVDDDGIVNIRINSLTSAVKF